jgi:hypothetical protein
MSEDLSTRLEKFATGQYRPTTFLERGVVVPFTTPQLVGARLRPSPRHKLDLVIANPSGGRGFYVVAWSALPKICAPTLHDERLWSVLAEQPQVTPSLVREAAQHVAIGGFAGRAAAAAALAARRQGPAAALEQIGVLMTRMIRQTETPDEARRLLENDTATQRDARSRRAILRVAPKVAASAPLIGDWLASLANLLQDVGTAEAPQRARRQMAEIRATVREVTRWASADAAAQDLEVGPMIGEVADLSLQCADRVMELIDRELNNVEGLLRRWRSDAEGLRTLVGRMDWLLDGWSLICGMWREAIPADRLAVSWEMAMLVPVLPREAEAWCGVKADWDSPRQVGKRRSVRAMEDWRTGTLHDLIARNERLRARAA